MGALTKSLMENPQDYSKEEAMDCMFSLRQLALEKKSKHLNSQIATMEKQGDKDRVRSLLSQRLDIAKKLAIISQRNT